MDYKFTFEDGSKALAHHGVKGMKWGVRNAETLARYGMADGAAGGGGGVSLDEDVDWYEEALKIANDPTYNSANDKTMALMGKALSELKKTEQYKAGEKAVDDLMSSVEKTRDIYEKSNQLSDSERAELRAKAKAQKKEETRKRRESARESGNPLWMLM